MTTRRQIEEARARRELKNRRELEGARALRGLAECSTPEGLEASKQRSRDAIRAWAAVIARYGRGEAPTMLEAVRCLMADDDEDPGGDHYGAWDALRAALAGRNMGSPQQTRGWIRRVSRRLAEHRDWLRTKGYSDDGAALKMERNIKSWGRALEIRKTICSQILIMKLS